MPTAHHHRAALALLVLGSVALLPACSESATDPTAGQPPETTGTTGTTDGADATPDARTDTYTGVLGVIDALPVEGDPETDLRIHHEHLPGFLAKDGTVFVTSDGVPGMKSMSMPFPPREGVDISTLRVGDKVRFSFEVHYGGTPPWELTGFEKLDPATEIDFADKVTHAADDPAPTQDGHSGHDHSGHDHP